MDQLTRDNHYVPQFYLKYWSPDNKNIWTYRTLVSHDHIPEWRLAPIKGTAVQRDLYTSRADKLDNDEFEKYIADEIENPVQESLRKVWKDNKLTKTDWERLAYFFALQDIRTEQAYLDFKRIWEPKMEIFITESLASSISKLEKLLSEGKKIPKVVNDSPLFKNSMIYDIEKNVDDIEGGGYVNANFSLGREFWLETQQHNLLNNADVLCKHKWSIVKPVKGCFWITSDHPVVKLNYYDSQNYDMKGGWARENGYLFMPLTPRHMMYTKIGYDMAPKKNCDHNQTKSLQGFLAERAYRFIFSNNKMILINKMRPRIIDAETYKFLEDQWKNWPEQQNESIDSLHKSK